MEIICEPSELESLNKVVSKAELNKLTLISCNVFRPIENLNFSNMGAVINFNAELMEEKKDSFVAGITLSLVGTPKNDEDDETKPPVVQLECKYALYYLLKDKKDIKSEDLEIFCDINAVYNAWPYIREFITTMANKMETPPITLPFLKIKPKKRKRKPKTSETLKK